MEEIIHSNRKRFFIFFFVCVFIIFHHPIVLDAFGELKTHHICLKKCLIYLQLAFFIFGSDWILAL